MSTSYSHFCNSNQPSGIENSLYYFNSYQNQEKYNQYQTHYYIQAQAQYQMGSVNEEEYIQNVYSTNAAYQLPIFDFDDSHINAVSGHDINGSSNVLQDDNFSIVTASDLYYNNNSPSLLSSTQLTPFSTPSPQISAITGDTATNFYDISCATQYTTSELFAPVHEFQPTISNTKKVPKATACKASPTTSLEKKHICPVCSHRSKRKHNLVEHMLTHNPHRPKSFLCGHCSRPFARKYDMKRHEKIHTRK